MLSLLEAALGALRGERSEGGLDDPPSPDPEQALARRLFQGLASGAATPLDAADRALLRTGSDVCYLSRLAVRLQARYCGGVFRP